MKYMLRFDDPNAYQMAHDHLIQAFRRTASTYNQNDLLIQTDLVGLDHMQRLMGMSCWQSTWAIHLTVFDPWANRGE